MTDTYEYTRHLVLGNGITGDVTRVDPAAPPVVLVHGFLGTRGTMEPMARRFRADGRAVFSYGYGRFQLACLRRSAQGLVQQVRKIREQLECDRVDLVGFSMGGLVGLHALKFLDAGRYCRSLALLGTPVRGTWMGLAGIAALGAVSSSVWQVVPSSRFLEDLLTASLPERVRVRQIYASRDALCPLGPRLAEVPDRDYVIIPGGHSSLVVGPRFYTALRGFHDGIDPSPTSAQMPGPGPAIPTF